MVSIRGILSLAILGILIATSIVFYDNDNAEGYTWGSNDIDQEHLFETQVRDPKDLGQNFNYSRKCGSLYEVTGEDKAARSVVSSAGKMFLIGSAIAAATAVAMESDYMLNLLGAIIGDFIEYGLGTVLTIVQLVNYLNIDFGIFNVILPLVTPLITHGVLFFKYVITNIGHWISSLNLEIVEYLIKYISKYVHMDKDLVDTIMGIASFQFMKDGKNPFLPDDVNNPILVPYLAR